MRLRGLVCALGLSLVAATCVSTPDVASVGRGVDISWLPAAATLQQDPGLDEAAALLCARDTDAVIDDDVRAAAFLWEGRVLAVMGKDRDSVVVQSEAVFRDQGLTHLGVAEGGSSDGRRCVAAIATRRLLEVSTLPRADRRDATVPSIMAVSVSTRREGRVFVLGPDGFVDRVPLDGAGKRQSVTLPFRREGRHVVEVLVDDVDADGVARGAPEVALLWPYLRGNPGLPMPVPEVLFPDEGHDDQALTYRAEALVQRLRNEQLLEPLKISPVLGTLAAARAVAVKDRAALGHRLEGQDPKMALRERFGDDNPRAQFIRLAEVQARGSTLKDAWEALVDSPGHRYELVAMGVTHVGVSVMRATDPLGRPTVTLVGILGRRPPVRDPTEVQKRVLDEVNRLRTGQGFQPLTISDTLETTARRLATRMMEVGRVDDTLLGGPVGEVALEADASITKVYPLVARIDDPLLLGPFRPLLDLDTTAMGASFALHPKDGVFYVVILAGIGSE